MKKSLQGSIAGAGVIAWKQRGQMERLPWAPARSQRAVRRSRTKASLQMCVWSAEPPHRSTVRGVIADVLTRLWPKRCPGLQKRT